MALNCYVTRLDSTVLDSVEYASITVVIRENGAILMDGSVPYYFGVRIPLNTNGNQNGTSVRNALHAKLITDFNDRLNRADGASIQINWLDPFPFTGALGGGLLGGLL